MTGRLLRVPRPRSDALPDGMDYPDAGCSLHPVCLTCPLPACRYDASALHSRPLRDYLADRARRLRSQGIPLAEIAAALGVSRRTLFRYLSPRL